MLDRKCSYIYIIVCISLWFVGGLIILGGFIRESVENHGYTIEVCQISGSMIAQDPNSLFDAYIAFRYISNTIFTTKWFVMRIFPTYEEAKNYIKENYPKGKYIPCYIAMVNSSDVDIRLSLYNQMYTVTVGVILFFVSIGSLLVYIIVVIIQKYKRRNYREIEGVKDSTQSGIAF